MVMSAKIGVTQKILYEYSAALGKNPHFQAWFAAAQAGNRLIIKQPEDATSKVAALISESLHYGVAGYFSGGRLCKSKDVVGLDLPALQALGVASFDVSEAPPTNIPGDNPILTLSLVANGRLEPVVLNDFLSPEDEIIIYDKYINEAGMQLIEHVATQLSQTARIHVRTTNLGKGCKDPIEILTRIANSNANLQASCKLVSTAFRQQAHDRYIFFGKRLQAVFTAGLDCFGALRSDGTRRNKQSKINVYALDSQALLAIEASDGSFIHTPHIESHRC
jgi:hypothetical protein